MVCQLFSQFLLPFIFNKVLRTTTKSTTSSHNLMNQTVFILIHSSTVKILMKKTKGNESAGWGNWLWVRPIWSLSNWVMCNHACTHAHVVPPLDMVSLSSAPTYSAVWLTQTSHPKILTYCLQISRELQRDVPNVQHYMSSESSKLTYLIHFPLSVISKETRTHVSSSACCDLRLVSLISKAVKQLDVNIGFAYSWSCYQKLDSSN